MARTGADVLVEVFRQEKVDLVFGYPGGSVIPIFDKLYDCPDIRLILPRHEQGGGHAADGYARASGRVGVCIATSGPGATNLTTALATANFDSVPMVAITGQVKTHLIGNDAFQEADITGITRPITKHGFLVKDVNELGRTLKAAFHIATTGRPGPVVVDLPSDVTTGKTDVPVPEEVNLPGYKPHVEGNVRQIKLAAEAINAAERPVIYAGGGIIISEASALLRQLAEKANVPVTTTLLGLGGFPENSPLSLQMLGMHGTAYANYAIMESDLIVAIGARFDDRITGNISKFAPHAKIVHVDIDPTSISKNIRVHIPVVGDAHGVLERMVEQVRFVDRKDWFARIADWKKKYPMTYAKDGLRPQYVIEQLDDIFPDDTIVCTEVGQNQMWAAQYYQYKYPRTFISSGGLGTMGFGLPAAIGAQFACPGRTVVDIAGDGSIQMNIQEMATAVHHKLPIKIIILNNGYLGMVRQWQELFYEKRYSGTLLEGSPDFVKLAEAYGAVGLRCTDAKDVRSTLKQALDTPNVVIAEFIIEREENVFPMVPAGEAIDRMIGGMS